MKVNNKINLWDQFSKYSEIIKNEKNTPKVKSKRKLRLENFAISLNENLPSSEKWFWFYYREYEMVDNNDLPNVPIKRFIYDVVNEKYKYIVEIDGSIHKNPEQQKIDNRKNHTAIGNGYKIFRIKAFDLQSFFDITTKIKALREKIDKLRKPRVILRKNSKDK